MLFSSVSSIRSEFLPCSVLSSKPSSLPVLFLSKSTLLFPRLRVAFLSSHGYWSFVVVQLYSSISIFGHGSASPPGSNGVKAKARAVAAATGSFHSFDIGNGLTGQIPHIVAALDATLHWAISTFSLTSCDPEKLDQLE
uniref:Uncharacterized protein n=1 Tax=Caenorhabditis japonica TaxID=281687 RepID=A0A8R1ER79_CAEJA